MMKQNIRVCSLHGDWKRKGREGGKEEEREKNTHTYTQRLFRSTALVTQFLPLRPTF